MAGGATSQGLTYLLNLIRNGDVPVATYFVALVRNDAPGFSMDSEDLDEPDVEEYSRAEMANDSGNWSIDDNVLSNTLEITFPPALTEWGTINFWAICDQPQDPGGRVLFSGQFDSPLFVAAGDQVYLDPGAVGVDMGGNQWLMIA